MKLLKLLVVAIALSTINGFAQTDFEPYTQNIEGTNVSFKMVPIKGATFMLGASKKDKKKEADELPQKQVEVSSFWMGVYEVTHKEFLLFTDATRDKLADGSLNPDSNF